MCECVCYCAYFINVNKLYVHVCVMERDKHTCSYFALPNPLLCSVMNKICLNQPPMPTNGLFNVLLFYYLSLLCFRTMASLKCNTNGSDKSSTKAFKEHQITADIYDIRQHISDDSEITIDLAQLHESQIMTNLQNSYDRGLFTDCHLVVGEEKIACHRVVLSACSPVLHNMLTSGMTETESCIIPVTLFVHDIMERIVK